MIVFDSVYDAFRDLLLERTGALSVGSGDDDDLGPVINERQLNNMLAKVEAARDAGATILAGGERLSGGRYANGFFMAATLIA
jgi:aldehyde dehydrogenase (NAD+)